MAYSVKDFVQAAEEFVNKSSQVGYWFVFPHYCAVGPEAVDGVYVVAPTLSKDVDTQPQVVATSDFDDRVAEDGEAVKELLKSAEMYTPLTVNGLFLEFAELGDQETITLDAMLDWVERFGVLGLQERSNTYRLIFAHFRGGPKETLSRFSYEAWKANAVLRLYEAATDPVGPDTEKLSRYTDWFLTPAVRRVFRYRLDDPAILTDVALRWVEDVVQQVVAENCYPALYRKENTFYQQMGFKSLLDAMYLQMMWLMTATGETRRCQGPGCNEIITFDQPKQPVDAGLKKNARGEYRTRKDKRFCSVLCRVKNHQRKRTTNLP